MPPLSETGRTDVCVAPIRDADSKVVSEDRHCHVARSSGTVSPTRSKGGSKKCRIAGPGGAGDCNDGQEAFREGVRRRRLGRNWLGAGLRSWVSSVGACLTCVTLSGCGSAEGNPQAGLTHDAVLAQYQRVVDQVVALVESQAPTDAAFVAEVRQLSEKAMDLRHKKLTVPNQPSLEQIQRYESLANRLQTALRTDRAASAICPTCPKHRR